MNILVVEDQPAVRELLAAVAAVAFRGARVQAVGDLESAIGAARATPMNLVLLDLGLPGCKGVDAVRRFKEAFPEAVTVVISANDDRQVIASALDAGASGYLPKGLSAKGMAAALSGLMPSPGDRSRA
jgi:DNA-binding NarL/FixJ family response regulator